MKKIRNVALIIALFFGGLYLYPAPSATFEELYAKVDPEIAASLRSFRSANPIRTVEVDGRTWSYYAAGPASGAPETLLFLHGMTGAHDIWWRQLEALRNRYRVISVTYPPVHSLGEMETGVLAILAKEKVRTFNLVGSSLGGYFAQYLVAAHPDRVRRAVFANTFPPNEIIARKNRFVGAALPYLPAWLIMRVFSRSIREKVYPASGNSELVLAFGLEQTHGRMNKEQIVGRFRCVIERFDPPDLEAARIPVLLIEADNDPLVEETLRGQLKAAYPSARVMTLSGAGHFPYLNDAEAYTRLLNDFFGGR